MQKVAEVTSITIATSLWL